MARKSSRGSYAIVMGILLIIMGVFLAIGGFGAAKSILNWFVLVIGIVLVIYGILSILAGLLLFGIIEIVIGIVIAAMASQFAWIALIVLAVAFIVYAIQDLVRGKILTLFAHRTVDRRCGHPRRFRRRIPMERHAAQRLLHCLRRFDGGRWRFAHRSPLALIRLTIKRQENPGVFLSKFSWIRPFISPWFHRKILTPVEMISLIKSGFLKMLSILIKSTFLWRTVASSPSNLIQAFEISAKKEIPIRFLASFPLGIFLRLDHRMLTLMVKYK
jgi:vacuolar-type H+-ATPase subunit I/STV1